MNPFGWTLIGQILGTIVGALASILGAYWNEKRRAKTTDRQWRQDQKGKIYSQILGAVNDYTVWLGDVSEARKFGNSSTGTTMEKGPAHIAEGFNAAAAVAPLFLSKSSLGLLERAKPAFSYHSSPFGDPNVDAADKYWELLRDIRIALTSSAMRDLG